MSKKENDKKKLYELCLKIISILKDDSLQWFNVETDKKIPKEKVKIRKGYTRHKEIRGQYPGNKVQVNIKYVPKECLLFDTIDKKYYQITAIDEFSRKRILEIVDEKSVTNTSKFIRTLEEKMGLKINTIQTDNGPEFVNNQIETNLPTLFELT